MCCVRLAVCLRAQLHRMHTSLHGNVQLYADSGLSHWALPRGETAVAAGMHGKVVGFS